MDGITDCAFREIIASYGGADIIFTEFVHANAVNYSSSSKRLSSLFYTDKQKPIIIQLFGARPEDFYLASQKVVAMGFDAIDINMGCPAPRVVKSGGGCALMKNTNLAIEILDATIRGAKEQAVVLGKDFIEVSVKMRLGIEDKDTVFKHGLALAKAGATAITIHARTLKQMYSGEADWSYIKKFVNLVKENNLRTLVIGSGDIRNLIDAFVKVLYTGVDGFMIARGMLGRPWLFEKNKIIEFKKEIAEFLRYTNKKSGEFELEEILNNHVFSEIKAKFSDIVKPSLKEIAQVALKHAEVANEKEGGVGIIKMRKHLAWYFQGFENAAVLRSKLVRVNSLDEIKFILDEFLK